MAAALPKEYGFVVATAIASGFVYTWMSFKVGAARKKYGVDYPKMYALDSDCKTPKDAKTYNCIQRAHQNSLEGYTLFLTLLLLGGLQHPTVSAVGGVVYLLGRIFYFNGYSTGEPKKRMQGTFGYLGLVTILGASIHLALNLLQLL